ncbi:MAG: DUF932 domain-containing protein [Syntrophaceae bacterium]|nr:DUF932 domain-containing protein [Syntrophaceae bacterium]
MSHLTTLGAVLEKVNRMSFEYSDHDVPVREIEFHDLENVSIDKTSYPIQPIAQQSVANRLGIPITYLRRCPPEVQRYNMNYWIKYEKNEELFFRFKGNEVRAIFTPRYVPTDNLEILEQLQGLGYPLDTPVQASVDDAFMMVNILDGEKGFSINGDRMTPGIAISNSEVGIAALSIAAFVLRLVCTNGLVSRTKVSASYRHISAKILEDFPRVLDGIGQELLSQRHQLHLSLNSRVEHPESTIESFNRQFQLTREEQEAVNWALPLEYGETMYHVVNVYTKASQYQDLAPESVHRLQRTGGMILGMVN